VVTILTIKLSKIIVDIIEKWNDGKLENFVESNYFSQLSRIPSFQKE
jgi:hypothetical protein